MILILLGAPGAGKGTQAAYITKSYQIPHISTGDILRTNISQNTPLGVKAKSYIDSGQLVPDNLILEIIRERITENDCRDGFLMDGFLRNINQAEEFEKVLNMLELDLTKVINLHVESSKIMGRLVNRRFCPQCNRIYNLKNNPPRQDTICDECSVELKIRDDDQQDVIEKRLQTYHSQTEPLIRFYETRGKLLTIEGDNIPEAIFKSIQKELSIEKNTH